MLRLQHLLTSVALALCVAGCSTPPERTDVGSEWHPPTAIEDFRFIRVGEVADATMREVASALVDGAPRVLETLGISRQTHGSDAMFTKPVDVFLWHNQSEFAEAFVGSGGEAPGIPENFADGYVRHPPEFREIHVFDRGEDSGRIVLHEYAHVVTLAIQPNLPHKPSWLWEGAAQYLADKPPEPKNLGCLTNENAPSMLEIHDFPGALVYNDVAYYMVEFIVQKHGFDKLLELIYENGNTERVLGVSEDEMHRSWVEWMRASYELSDLTPLTSEELKDQMTNNTFDQLEHNLSTYQRADGVMIVGTKDAIGRAGQWGIEANGKVFVEMPGSTRRHSTWYRLDENRYNMLPQDSCKFYEYRRRLGNEEGFVTSTN